jgi:hypothetical protein
VKVALAQQWFAEFATVRDQSAAGIADPSQALIARCQAYASYALAHLGPYRLMFGTGLPGSPPPPAVPAPPAKARSTHSSPR